MTTLPYDYIEAPESLDEPGARLNLPCPLGEALGAELARLVGPGPNSCHDCAFRLGTVPNRSLSTVANALKCAIEGEPFFCHHEKNGENPPCDGWVLAQCLHEAAKEKADA